MAFCTNCGHQLADGAKFCFECGAKVTTSTSPQREHRKIVFDGEIHKCPYCGEVLNSFSAMCPACGNEIRDKDVTFSIKSFLAKLESANNDGAKISIIRNFPVPNTKEDVYEFMLLASNNILSNDASDLRRTWQAKFDQIYQRAKIILPEKDFTQISLLYEETLKKLRSNDIAQTTKATGKVVSSAFAGVGLALLWIVKQIPTILGVVVKNVLSVFSILAYLKAIQIDRLRENGVGYELLGWVLSISSALLLRRKNVTYFEILFVGCCGGLHFYLANFLENGSGLQLFGAITLVLVFIAFVKKVKPSE